MRSRLTCALAVLSLVVAFPAAAQRKGTIEVGAFARYVNFDNTLGLDNAVAVGGRAAVYLGPTFAIELDIARSSDHTPLHYRAVYNGPVSERVEALVGFGFVHNWYGDAYHVADDGLSGVLGLRYHVSSQLWLRVGTDLDLMFHTSQESLFDFYTGNWGLHLGIGALVNK